MFLSFIIFNKFAKLGWTVYYVTDKKYSTFNIVIIGSRLLFNCQVLSSRNVELLLGYYVNYIKKAEKVESGEGLADDEAKIIAEWNDSETFILNLQPAERGLPSKVIEADLVLWTVGSKPLLPELEPCSTYHAIPLNARGQVETDETLRVKGYPRIFAIGDSSALRDSSGKLLPATAQVK